MRIEKTPLYERQKQKLIKKGYLKRDLIEKSEELFIDNPTNYKLRPHKIICKKNKNRVSLSILNTGYRILYTKDNDRVNKDC